MQGRCTSRPESTTKLLVVEGWRRSSHSYALVNQQQLPHLGRDPRFSLYHLDIPLLRPEWAQADSGLGAEARGVVESLSAPDQSAPDVIYRISWPLRVHAGGASKVLVFGTAEMQLLQARDCCGPSGTADDVDRDAVEIITPSEWSRSGFVASGFDACRVHVIPHGVDPAMFSRSSAEQRRLLRAALQIPNDANVFLNIGAMTWNKGIGPLLAAFAAYRQRDQRAILLLKGGDQLYGNLMHQCLAEASRLLAGGIPQHVLRSIRYTGKNLKLAEIAQMYQVSDVYVSPYRAEGFNLPVLEALASGVVPIVTAGGSTDDFCPDHLSLKIASQPTRRHDGAVFLEPALDSLVACMQRSIEDEALRRRVELEGPRWVAQRYTWERVSGALADRLAA